MKNRFQRLRAKLLLLLAGLGACGSAAAQTPASFPSKFELGFNYSRGDYGLAQDTEVFVVPASLSFDSPDWGVRLTVPWITIKGPASAIEGGGIPIRPTASSQSGFGDATAGLTYKFLHEANHPQLSFTGRVKFATGNEDRGLSTGETDYYAQADLLQTFGSVTPFITAGYRWLGSNTLYPLIDGFYASGGLAFSVAPGTSVGAAYEWRQALVRGGDEANEVSVFLYHKVNDRWSFNLSVMKGFTDASANYGGGGSVIYSF